MEHAFGLTIPRTLEEVCDPVHTALIVYDMQVGIVSQLPDGSAVAKRVADACGSGNKDAGQRALDSLAFCGGSLQTDVKTICGLLNRSRAPV